MVLKPPGTYILRGTTNCDNFVFMKQYVIDELRPKDYELVKAYLEKNFSSLPEFRPNIPTVNPFILPLTWNQIL